MDSKDVDEAAAENDSAAPDEARNGGLRRLLRGRFTQELLVVVLGVLIALGIGEIAEAIRWHQRGQAARASFNAEFALNAARFHERVISQPCLERRLAEVGDLIRAAQETGRLPRVGRIGQPNLRPISTAAWETAGGNGVTLRMKPEEVTELGSLVKLTASYYEWSTLEQEEWAALSALEGAERAVSQDLISEMARTLAVVRYRTELQGLAAQQALNFIESRGIAPAYDDFGKSPEQMAAALPDNPMCQPLASSS